MCNIRFISRESREQRAEEEEGGGEREKTEGTWLECKTRRERNETHTGDNAGCSAGPDAIRNYLYKLTPHSRWAPVADIGDSRNSFSRIQYRNDGFLQR